MPGTITHASAQREEKDHEVSERHSPVDTERRQYEHGKPRHIERNKTRIAPLISDQLWELALEAGQIFFGEMQALYGNSEQTHRENCSRIVLPAGCDPEQIGDDQAHAEENSGAAHPASLCRHDDQHEDGPDNAIPRSHRIYPIRHSAASQARSNPSSTLPQHSRF